jgi:hypothetical protein
LQGQQKAEKRQTKEKSKENLKSKAKAQTQTPPETNNSPKIKLPVTNSMQALPLR